MSDLEFDLGTIRTLLREEVGIDPEAAAVVLDLAAIGITNSTWRNSPLEDWHGEGRIHDGGMLRTNVATTKLVREVLDDHLGEVFDDGSAALIATEDLADLDSDFSDELFMTIFERLSDPDRVLPDGRTLRLLAGADLDELVDHMDTTLAASPAAPSGMAWTTGCYMRRPTAGWPAPGGGGRRGGRTSWPSSLFGWMTRSIVIGARPVTCTRACRRSRPRSPIGAGSGRCCLMPLRCCPRRARSSVSPLGSATCWSRSERGRPHTQGSNKA